MGKCGKVAFVSCEWTARPTAEDDVMMAVLEQVSAGRVAASALGSRMDT